MNKEYLKFQIKQWLPLFGIFACILIILMISSIYQGAISTNVYASYYLQEGLEVRVRDHFPMYELFIGALIFTFITPLFILDHRYNYKKADTCLQLPINGNKLNLQKLLLCLVMTLIVFISIYSISILITFFVQLGKNPITLTYIRDNARETIEITYYYNYGYLFLSLIIMCVFIAIEQFINCSIGLLANTKVDAVLYIIISFLIRWLLVGGIFGYIYSFTQPAQSGALIGLSFLGNANLDFSFLYPAIKLNQWFSILVANSTYEYSTSPLSLSLDIITGIIYILLGIGSIIFFIFYKEKHNENIGRKRNETLFDTFFPHVGVLASFIYLSLLLSSSFNLIIIICAFLFSLLVYYVIIAIINRSFKIKPIDFALGGIVTVVYLILLGVNVIRIFG